MGALILFIAYLQILIIRGLWKEPKNLKGIFIESMILFSATIVAITELLSVCKVVTFRLLFLFWFAFSVVCLIYIIFNKDKCFKNALYVFAKFKLFFKELDKLSKLLFFALLGLIAFLFFQGIVYPPNNYDSMTYHMARIPHWISNSSVMHYPTHIYRQIYQPPFAEFVILHINLLSKSDLFSNSVQLFFLVFSVITLIGIMEQLGIDRKYNLVAAIFIITIPEVILQSTSTQNDIVVSYFILSAVYYGNICIRDKNIQSFVFLGLSVGLAVLTKGTAYIFLAPLLVYIAIKLLANLQKRLIWNSLLASLIFLCINFGHFYRNYELSDNLLGVNKIQTPEEVININFSPVVITINFFKNIGLHVGPSSLHHLYKKALNKLFSIDGFEKYDSKVNFEGISFNEAIYLPNHEDYGSNTLHFYMILFAFLYSYIGIAMLKKRNTVISGYSLMILGQIFLFILLLKWQPWHSRLHTPIFILSIPLICYAFDLIFKGSLKLTWFVLTILIIQSYYLASTNYSRVIFPFHSTNSKVSFTDTRFKKYFAIRPELYYEYMTINKQIVKFNNKNIGLILGGDDWEYPLFTEIYSKEIFPIHINVTNKTKDLNPLFNMNIDCIVSTTVRDSLIIYNEEIFYNKSLNNQHIYYFGK